MQVPIDQNFPEPILNSLTPFVQEIEFLPVRKIASHLPHVDDRELLIELHNRNFTWLVTLNYKMLLNPVELAAIIATKINVFAIEGLGHDPIRATGVLLMHLTPAIEEINRSGRNGIFWIRHRQLLVHDPWNLFVKAAEHHNTNPNALYDEVKVSNERLRP
ncbi:MAG: hypothetical protein F4X68_02910 [Acidimicrobiia bacterium]|nr:hypothetical protein [Acidimicrobiia bacterium]MYB72901.1 hypothetical protein [Acidimicrobiia bacterium]